MQMLAGGSDMNAVGGDAIFLAPSATNAPGDETFAHTDALAERPHRLGQRLSLFVIMGWVAAMLAVSAYIVT